MPRLRPQELGHRLCVRCPEGYRAPMRTYESHCGERIVSRVRSYTPRHAVTDYLRSLGCRDDEMEAMSDESMAWRGAVYTAVEMHEPSHPAGPQPAED